MSKTKVLRIAAVGLIAAGLQAGFIGSASAASLPRDGQDPIAAGCSGDARTIYSNEISNNGNALGYIDLRYSPSCRTTWARIRDFYANSSDTAHIVRNGDNAGYDCGPTSWSGSLNAYSCYTPMVNDAGQTSWAWGAAYQNGIGYTQTTASY
jgi:hypothetical protein